MRGARLLALAALSSFPALPGLAGEADCLFQMGGKDVLVGPCDASAADASGSVSVASPDGATVVRIAGQGGVGQAYWNGGSAGTAADTLIGTVVRVGACWASDKAKLCVTR